MHYLRFFIATLEASFLENRQEIIGLFDCSMLDICQEGLWPEWGTIETVKRLEPFDRSIEQVKPSRGWNPLTEVDKFSAKGVYPLCKLKKQKAVEKYYRQPS